MKKKLFAVASVVSLYLLFVLVFTAFDNQGNITQFVDELGLSNSTALAFTPLSQTDASGSNKSVIKASLRDPMPPPLKKPKPRRKKRKKR